MGFSGPGFESHHPPIIINFSQDFAHVELAKKLSPVSPGNETAWILTGLPVYPADLLARRFRGGECYEYEAYSSWLDNWLTFCKWSNGLKPHTLIP